MAEWITITEMARRRGCVHGAVQKAITDGRIPEACVRRKPSGRLVAIECEAATAAWNANTDADQAARTPGGAATVVAAGTGELPLGQPKQGTASSVDVTKHRTASTEGKQLQNQLLELELLKEVGALVSRDEVRKISERRYRATRDQLLTVPDRVADILAAERDPARVHSILITELEQALHGLSESAAAESASLAAGAAAERVEA